MLDGQPLHKIWNFNPQLGTSDWVRLTGWKNFPLELLEEVFKSTCICFLVLINFFHAFCTIPLESLLSLHLCPLRLVNLEFRLINCLSGWLVWQCWICIMLSLTVFKSWKPMFITPSWIIHYENLNQIYFLSCLTRLCRYTKQKKVYKHK